MKKKKIWLLVIMLLLIPNIVKANWAECYTKLESDKSYSTGDIVTYLLGSQGLTGDTAIYGLHYQITYDPEILEPVPLNEGGLVSDYNWENMNYFIQKDTIYTYNTLIIDMKTDYKDRFVSESTLGVNAINDVVKLGSIKFKVLETSKSSTKIELEADMYNPPSYKYIYNLGHYEYDIPEKEIEQCVKGIDTYVNLYKKASLTAIEIDNKKLQNFNSETYTYNIDTTNKNISINALGDDVKVSGDIGKKSLNYGNNVFKISATSNTGDIKTYTLNINYIDSRSKINTLKVLSLGNENFKFYPTINSYTLTVDNTVENIEIKSELTDPKSTYVKGYGDRKVKLNVGENKILIKVQAENGNINTYTLNILREDKKESCYIKNIKIKNYKLNFDKTITNYTLNINNEDTALDISIELEDKESKYVIENNRNLKNGSTIVIKVTDKNEETKQYHINIVKESQKANKTITIIITALISSVVVLGLTFGVYFLIRKVKLKRR